MLSNFFWRNYIAIGVTSVKIIGKYAASGVNYAQKSFIILATVVNVWNNFEHVLRDIHTHTHTHQIKPLPNLT